MILPEKAPAGVPTGVADFDEAVLRFASDDLLWVLQAKVDKDRYSNRSTGAYRGNTKFELPEEGWYALERLILAESVIRIGRCETEPDDENYDSNLSSLADWLCNNRWALGVMDLRHQQGGQVRMGYGDVEEWFLYAFMGADYLKWSERPDWNPRLAAYLSYIRGLLQMQRDPESWRSLKPSDVRARFDEFLEIAEATTVDATTASKALPCSQEDIAERLNRQLSS